MGVDFFPLTRISFESGNYQACVSVVINPDANIEPTESFTLTIAPNQDNVAIGSPDVATLSIVDDDGRFVLIHFFIINECSLKCS